MKSLWRWGRLGVGLILTVICLWLALRRIPISGVIASLRQAQTLWVLLAVAALAVDYGTRVYRWCWLLRCCGSSVQLRACAWPFISSFAVNNVVPFRAGDVFRVMGFRQELAASASRVLATLLLERLLDLTVLLLFLLLGLRGLTASTIPAFYIRIAILACGMGVVAWLALVFQGQRLQDLVARMVRNNAFARHHFVVRLSQFSRELFLALKVIRAPRRFMTAIAMSTAVWIAEGAVFGAGAEAVSYDGRSWGPWFALATGSLSTLVPSSPGFVGTFDFFTLSGFSAYGASDQKAAAAALLIHGVLWFPLTAAGLIYLLKMNLSTRTRPGVTGATQKGEQA